METTVKKLFRSRYRVVGGVCGGLADYFGLDAARVRLATALLTLLGGLSVWVYILLWIVIPAEPIRR